MGYHLIFQYVISNQGKYICSNMQHFLAEDIQNLFLWLACLIYLYIFVFTCIFSPSLTEGEKWEVFYLLIHFPDVHNSLDCSMLKGGAKTSMLMT